MVKDLFVTRPLLPPLEEYIPLLRQIWEHQWLTNAGPFHAQLEAELSGFLGVESMALFANGTLALMTALEALKIQGEVITTPFSFVATSHALLWNRIDPVFVDICPDSLNLDPEKIERAISPRTTAILPVHVYGRPCDVDGVQQIAATHGLRVIYDAAHAFGVRYRGESLLRHGDLSVLSFHATKVFTTAEGGAIVCPDKATKRRIDDLKNFGFADEVTVNSLGINGKMNELQAAFGLLQLKYFEAALERRRAIDSRYRHALQAVPGLRIPAPDPSCAANYSYFPILVNAGYRLSRDDLHEKLRRHGIHARRYFYPLISDFPMYRHLPSADPARLPVANTIARQVLCLPIYPSLTDADMDRVIRVIVDG